MISCHRMAVRPQSQWSRSCFHLAALIAGFSNVLLQAEAHAEFVGSSGATQVTQLESGGFQYQYTITNTSDSALLTGWAIPFFDDAATSFVGGESSIFAPTGWSWTFTALTPDTTNTAWGYVAADDPKNATYGAPGTAFDNPPYALAFFPDFNNIEDLSQTAILPGASLGGFGYVSPYGSGVNVPFVAVMIIPPTGPINDITDLFQLTIGDPVTPQTPGFPNTAQVPEPTPLVMLLTGGLTALVASARRQRNPSRDARKQPGLTPLA